MIKTNDPEFMVWLNTLLSCVARGDSVGLASEDAGTARKAYLVAFNPKSQ